ncbi:TAT-variant-translocated molybdopterin oxidoreductase [Marinoscillum sp. MHG1-6]|uniref:TAT-variant-translocated molybdopterin oxidoreductase n=1 Tax=Marinoscillum sp. MHG1-6 TaxID=2959627 RepID=UPI002157E40E|nr:TAT-variant-translocated molybdopterin oxidoreductase [Marinoscillum sp. MHG1-6]
MKETKKYWKGLEQLQNTAEFQEKANKEFPEYLPLTGEGDESSRRDFLKLMGFGLAAVSLAACETPVRKAIPYVRKPETVDPSNANYYASTYVSGSDVCPVVVKTREGRPINVEGNKMSSVSGGGTYPQVQASVLSLYDKERLQSPLINGKKASWSDLDAAVTGALSAASGKIALVSHSVASPSTLAAISKLKEKYPSLDHVQYDSYSYDGLTSAYEAAFGTKSFPLYDFSKAKTIVTFGYDFLGSAPNATLSTKQFASTRKLTDSKKDMSRLYAFEANLTITGANADYRTLIKPSQEGLYVAALYNEVASKLGAATIASKKIEDSATIKKAAADLLKSKGASLVVSGSSDVAVQQLVIALNDLLGSYGSTIDASKSLKTRAGDDKKFGSFVSELKSGVVGGVIFYNCNPVYDSAFGADIQAGLAKVKFSLSTADRKDETSALVKYQAPDHHYLESWNDFEPISGSYSLSQPTIKNIFDTRQAQDSFLTWAGVETSYYDFIRSNWETYGYPSATGFASFDAYWDKCLHDGVYDAASGEAEVLSPTVDVASIASAISSSYTLDNAGLELVIYQKASIGDGTQANNPWLQEMPDPISKATWDNYLTVSPKQVEEWGIALGDMTTQLVKLTVGGVSLEVPVLPQPGQAYGTIGLALGYGRTVAGKVANGVGVNAYPLIASKGGSLSFAVTSGVSVEPTSTSYQIAQTQTHHTYMGRETVVQEALLKEYQKDPQAGRHFPKIATAEGMVKPYAVSLWKGHSYANHHWGLSIDLNSCTGCGACTVACQVENNIPVVGKEEVLNRREMHWIRIDRYYSSDATKEDGYTAMEKASANPEITFQPMMCQQCNNAPCETVCPVAATTHSTEGLNQMTYNRCIGTRYCANNCPYKVRRFNWFKYHDNKQFDKNMAMNNDLGKMVLNPDVTVRARGVMEKCTFCVQRIQAGKLEAKKEGRRPSDADVTTACASACPSEALVFGDMKNPESKISQMLKIQSSDKGVESKEPRAYHVLEELRVMPNVWYLTKIRNKDEKAVKEEAEA